MARKRAASGTRAGPSKKAKAVDTAAGNHDSTGAFTVPEEPAFSSRDAERAKLIKDALQKNPPGVRLVNPMSSPKDRHQSIAGYLGLTETIPLRIICDIDEEEALEWDPSEHEQDGDDDAPEPGFRQEYFRQQAMPIARALAVLADSKKVGFGADGVKSSFAPTAAQIIKAAQEYKDQVSEDDLAHGLPLDRNHKHFGPSSKNRRALASMLVGLHHILQAKPAWFHHSDALDPASPLRAPFLGAVCPEDWNAALMVWRWYVGTKQLEKTDRAVEQARNASISNWKNGPATRAVYLTDEDVRGVNDEEAKLTTSLGVTTRYALDALSDSRLQFLSQAPHEGASSQGEGYEQSVATALASIRAAYDPRKQTVLPFMDSDMLKAALIALIDKLEVAWPENFKGNYASQRDAAAATDACDETGIDHAQWLARSLQNSDSLGTLLDAGDTSIGDVLVEGAGKATSRLEQFTSVMQIMNAASSSEPSYLTSSRLLGLDPANPVVGSVNLDPHQVTGAAWSCCMLCVLRFALLCDDMGLGKTITAFSIVDRLYSHVLAPPLPDELVDSTWPLQEADLTPENLRPHSPITIFKPTVILFPSNASSTWKTECLKFPDMNVRFWFGDKSKYTDGSRESRLTLNNRWQDFVEFIEQLDPTSPDTGRTVILCTITTWVRRTTYFDNIKGKGKGKAKATDENADEHADEQPDEHAEDADDDIIEDYDHAAEDDQSEEQMRRLTSRVKGLIGLMIIDETHKLKNRHTRAHGSVFKAEPDFILGLTGTPVINRPTDMLGYLALLERQVQGTRFEVPPPPESADAYAGILDEVRKFPCVNLVPFDRYMGYLSPTLVRSRLQNISVGTDSMLDTRDVIAVAFALIVLRRVKGHVVNMHDGTRYIVGKDIPIPQVRTVKLEMDPEGLRIVKKTINDARPRLYQRSESDDRASRYVSDEGGDDNGNGDTETRLNIQVHRRCMLVSFSPLLALLPERTYVEHTDRWSDLSDHGYRAYVALTTPPDYPWRLPHVSRVTAATEMAMASPKLMAMAFHILHDVILGDRKVIFFVRWPITQWIAELFCFTLT